jgi:hypothetical protein
MFLYSGQTITPRVRFTGSVTGTPTAQLFVNGSASGSPVNGTGSGAVWVFSVTIPSVSAGAYLEVEVSGVVSTITQTKTVIQASVVELIQDGVILDSDIRTAIGLAAANLDAQLSAIPHI